MFNGCCYRIVALGFYGSYSILAKQEIYTSTIEKLNLVDFSEVADLWEASVRATHHFLKEEDIQFFKPLILNEFLSSVSLFGIRNQERKILGFIGTDANKIEMLFIHPDARGKGIGKRLLMYAIQVLQATEVDVNEQNPQAVGFYLHEGFVVASRSEIDSLGNPFPILHLRLSQ